MFVMTISGRVFHTHEGKVTGTLGTFEGFEVQNNCPVTWKAGVFTIWNYDPPVFSPRLILNEPHTRPAIWQYPDVDYFVIPDTTKSGMHFYDVNGEYLGHLRLLCDRMRGFRRCTCFGYIAKYSHVGVWYNVQIHSKEIFRVCAFEHYLVGLANKQLYFLDFESHDVTRISLEHDSPIDISTHEDALLVTCNSCDG